MDLSKCIDQLICHWTFIQLRLEPTAVQFSIQPFDFEDVVEIERGPPAGVFDGVVIAGTQQVVSEGA